MTPNHELTTVQRQSKVFERCCQQQELQFLDRLVAYCRGKSSCGPLFKAEVDAFPPRHSDIPAADLLVCTVGTSFAPILLSIAANDAKRVVLLLAPEYQLDGEAVITSETYGQTLVYEIERLRNGRLLPNLAQIEFQSTPDSPAAVFANLNAKVAPLLAGVTVAGIDVTGAKKSMTGGAYLFAAYAGMGIRYVDFLRYDPESGRPYADFCAVRELAHPESVFALGLWDRVRREFEARNYERARESAREWQQALEAAERNTPREGELSTGREVRLFADGEMNGVARLVEILGALADWQRGDLHSADDGLTRVAPSVPKPPILTSGVPAGWPVLGSTEASVLAQRAAAFEKAMFSDPAAVHAYAQEEMTKLEALAASGQDFRALFLRAHGLNELLCRVRSQLAFKRGEVAATSKSEETGETVKADGEQLLKIRDAVDREAALAAKLCFIGRVKSVRADGRAWSLTLCIGSPLALQAYVRRRRDQGQFGGMARLRNGAIHGFMPVPPATAQEALDFARWNAAAFAKQFRVGSIPEWRPDWSTVMEAAGVTLPSRKDR